jgi:arylsulfatase A-like enzyme
MRPLSFLLLCTLAAIGQSRAAAADDLRRPNILLILADDVGYGDVGFQGCRDIPTPHIDAIAARGARFTNGYVTAPVCSPSRAGLITGRYQGRFGHEFNPGPPQPTDLAEGGLPLTESTLAEALKAAGYATAIIGKWHLGESKEFWPRQRGFDEFYGFLGANHPYFPGEGSAILRNDKKTVAPPHLTRAFGDEAAQFIARQTDKPFFLYLAFNAAHTPLQPDKEHLARFAHIADKRRRAFAGLVSGMDDAVGQALDALKVAGKEDNTIIIFLSDNGGPQHANGSSNAPLRGDKLTLWEGGIRIPFAIQWAGKVAAGSTFDKPVTSLDAVATAVAAAGAADRPLDGVNLLPYLANSTKEAPHKTLYWRFGTQHAVRQGNFKLLQFEKGPSQLYDLGADLGESHDLAGTQPEIVERLDAAYQAWDSQLVDPLWKRHRMGTRPAPSAGEKSRQTSEINYNRRELGRVLNSEPVAPGASGLIGPREGERHIQQDIQAKNS